MSDLTLLDRAHEAMEAGGEAERRLFYFTLAATTLYVPLEDAAEGTRVTPMVLDTGEGRFALGFDTELRLAGFVPGGADYAGLAGRDLIAMLAEAGVGLGVNLDTAPSAILLPAGALDWIAGRLAAAVTPARRSVSRPDMPLSADLVAVLDRVLPLLAGHVRRAVLVADGAAGAPTLVLVDVPGRGEELCLTLLSEAFALLETTPPAVDFLPGTDPGMEEVLAKGIVIDMPDPEPAQPSPAPDRPPCLI